LIKQAWKNEFKEEITNEKPAFDRIAFLNTIEKIFSHLIKFDHHFIDFEFKMTSCPVPNPQADKKNVNNFY